MKGLFQNGLFIFFLIITVFLLGLAIVSYASGGIAAPVSNLINTITTPVQGLLTRAGENIDGLFDYFEGIDALKAENEELKLRLSESEELLRDAEQYREENERYRALLGLRERRRDFKLESAYIVGRDGTGWAARYTIDKGANYGIEPRTCVITPEGFLGIITEVGYNWAEFICVVDTTMQAGAIVSRTGAAAVVEGDFELMQQGRLKLAYLAKDADIVEGDTIETSGLGSILPSGLLIGTVEAIVSESHGISNYAVIRPAVKLDELSQVFVIKAFDIVE